MTTQLNHSPAPWRVFPTQDQPFRLEIVDEEGCTIAVLDASDEALGAMEDDKTLQGDAALMAAGPKLLQAARCALADLEGLIFGMEIDPDDPDDDSPVAQTIRELRTVIGEAEGGAQ
ncbi:MAG: hypothetical protein WC869_11255 [Phycisphaerae bacterium]|jgi:hypothetical protein